MYQVYNITMGFLCADPYKISSEHDSTLETESLK